jgi:hypothetical protein
VRKTVEVQTLGFDENLQTAGADSFGGQEWFGLRVPQVAPPSGANIRFMFLLASVSLAHKERVTVKRIRTFVSIGASYDSTLIYECPVVDPFWRFPDGANATFHLLRVAPEVTPRLTPQVSPPSQSYENSKSPALLYETPATYTGAQTYLPPYNGIVQGNYIVPSLSYLRGAQSPWWKGIRVDEEVEGPGTIQLVASVMQTTQGNWPSAVPSGLATTSGFAAPDSFLSYVASGGESGFASLGFYRVAGALVLRAKESKVRPYRTIPKGMPCPPQHLPPKECCH